MVCRSRTVTAACDRPGRMLCDRLSRVVDWNSLVVLNLGGKCGEIRFPLVSRIRVSVGVSASICDFYNSLLLSPDIILNLRRPFNRRLRKRSVVIVAEESLNLLTAIVSDFGVLIKNWWR